MAINPLYMSMC